MNQQRSSFSITYDSQLGVIYVFGGAHICQSGGHHDHEKEANNATGFLNHCEKLSLKNDKWTVMAPMRKKKILTSSCMFNNEFIYVIGGKGEDDKGNFGQLNDIEKYSIKEDKWDNIQMEKGGFFKKIFNTELTPRNSVLAFQISPTCILIAGGLGKDEFKNDSYLLNTNEDAYKPLYHTLKKASDLDSDDMFKNQQVINFKNNVFALGT